MSGTVMVTALPETVTALAFTNWLAVPPPSTIVAFILMANAAIDEGTVVFVLNVTVIDPPTGIAVIPVAPDTVIVYWPMDRAFVGETTTVAAARSALASLVGNIPKANVVDIRPMAIGNATPTNVPILVFTYRERRPI